MKLLIALALFAVACAEVQVVHLPPPAAPAYELPDVSNDLRVRVVDAPLAAPEAVPVDDAFKVRVVDSPLHEVQDVKIAAPQPVEAVRVVDAPLPAAEAAMPVVEPAMPVVEPVRIAEPRLPGKQYPDPTWR